MLESRIPPQLKAVLLAAALVAGFLLFQALVTLVLLLFITVLIAIPLSAIAMRLDRWRVPRALGALVGLALGIGVVAGVVRLVIPPFARELRNLAVSAPQALDDLRVRYLHLVGGHPSSSGDQLQHLLDRFLAQPLTFIEPLLSVGLGVVGAVFTTVLVLLTAYYIAARPQPLLDGALQLFPPRRREWAEHVMRRLRTAWVGWLQGVVADMFLTGTLTYIGLSIIGLDFSLVFAVLSALLVVIPYFGSIAGAVPPVLLGLTESPGRGLLVLGVYVLVQQVEGNLIIPLIMAQRVRLHPALIAIGVVAVGALFGVVGLFIAVPILSTVQILVDELWVRPAERAHGRRLAAAGRGSVDRPGPERAAPEPVATEPEGQAAPATGTPAGARAPA